MLKVNSAENVPTAVFTLGDHAYPMATDRQLRRCFTPSWGDPKKGIMKVIRPSMGNHDWQASRGVPYYRYFGPKAGEVGKGYYSYDIGDWHVVSLNSELAAEGNRAEISAQEEWLKADLRDRSKFCTVAYFHRPLFSSAFRQGAPEMRPIWEILYANNVDLVLGGHDHHYERFLPQTPAGSLIPCAESSRSWLEPGERLFAASSLDSDSCSATVGEFGNTNPGPLWSTQADARQGGVRSAFIDVDGECGISRVASVTRRPTSSRWWCERSHADPGIRDRPETAA